MHQFQGIGNAGRDAELKQLPSGVQVAECSVGIDVYAGAGKDRETLWVRLAVFGKRGESFARHVRKGTKIWFAGKLKANAFVGQDGQARVSVDVTADDWGFAGPPPQNQGYDRPQQAPASKQAPAGYGSRSQYPPAAPMPEDGEIPF